MVTPDFEEWLGRQEIPVEETTDVEKYLKYLEEELGVHGGSLEIARGIYGERYKGLEEYGIRPIERHYLYMGEPFVETRYAIKGEPGLWGKLSAYRIAEERAAEAGEYEIAETMHARLEEMERAPERIRRRWEERT